jgi:hypothetical protein
VILSTRLLVVSVIPKWKRKERTRCCVIGGNAAHKRLADWTCQVRCSMRATAVAKSTFNHKVGAFGAWGTWFHVGAVAVGSGMVGSACAADGGAFALGRDVAKGVAVKALDRLRAVLLCAMQMAMES